MLKRVQHDNHQRQYGSNLIPTWSERTIFRSNEQVSILRVQI